MMGGDFIDYVIADKTVVPFEHQPFRVHLPDCYQVNYPSGRRSRMGTAEYATYRQRLSARSIQAGECVSYSKV
jgi:hypothetical protein